MRTEYKRATRKSLKIINTISLSVPLATNRTFKRSSCPLGRNLTAYIHRQPTVCFPDSKEINFHVSLARKAVASSSIALLYSGSNNASWYDFGRDIEDNLVTKLKYVGDKWEKNNTVSIGCWVQERVHFRRAIGNSHFS